MVEQIPLWGFLRVRDPPKPIANVRGSVLITPLAHLILPHHLFPAAHCRCLGRYSQSEMMGIQAPDVLSIFLHRDWCWRCLTLCATGWDTSREVESSLVFGVLCALPTASHLHYCLTFLFISHAAFLFLTIVWISLLEQDRVLGRFFFSFFFFLNVVCCFCGGSFFLLSLSVIFSVPNQFYLPLL